LILESNCSPIDIKEVKKVKSDCWIVSPVFDEVPSDILEYFTTRREKNEFIMLDPQGYTRVADPTGRISIRKSMDLPINNLDGIKLDNLEISCFTEVIQGIDGMKKIHSKYKIDHVMYTEDRTIHLLENERHYWLNVPRTDTPDSTGLGDIIVSSFACSIIKEKDPVWAICFAAGALTAALQTREIGIQKVPHKSAIEENASYYYNILNYEKI
jgi:sugar/nucleoside kinase (ribokinase family)